MKNQYIILLISLASCTSSNVSGILDEDVLKDTLDEGVFMIYKGLPLETDKPFLLADSTFTEQNILISNKDRFTFLDQNEKEEILMPQLANDANKYNYINYNRWLAIGKRSKNITAVIQTSRVLKDTYKEKIFYRLSIKRKGDSGGEYEVFVKQFQDRWKITELNLLGIY